MTKNKLTPSKNAEKMAIQYLQHEFRKILNGIRDPKTWKLIDREIANLPETQGESSFWNLVAAVSEDWKLKSVYRVLSDTRFTWKLEEVPLEKITLTGMSPEINRYTLKQCGGDPMKFLALWKTNAKVRSDILKTGFSEHRERDGHPIFLAEIPDGLSVFDGMRRTLLAIIGGKKTIPAWVGKPLNKNGKPLISGGFGYVLSQLYRHTERKNKTIDQAFAHVVQIVGSDYRNGKELVNKRIAGWSRDERIKKIFRIK
jgi:hypothetical protein